MSNERPDAHELICLNASITPFPDENGRTKTPKHKILVHMDNAMTAAEKASLFDGTLVRVPWAFANRQILILDVDRKRDVKEKFHELGLSLLHHGHTHWEAHHYELKKETGDMTPEEKTKALENRAVGRRYFHFHATLGRGEEILEQSLASQTAREPSCPKKRI